MFFAAKVSIISSRQEIGVKKGVNKRHANRYPQHQGAKQNVGSETLHMLKKIKISSFFKSVAQLTSSFVFRFIIIAFMAARKTLY